MRIKSLVFFSFLCLQSTRMIAQAPPDTAATDLMKMLEDTEPAKKEYTTATFKSTRIANGHSIENMAKGVLDFRISHRFGTLNTGVKNFFGLDNAVTRIGFDYGLTNWLMIGVGRSSYLKEYDGFLKARLLRQTEDNKMPVSMSYLGATSVQTYEVEMPEGQEFYFTNRLAFIHQLLVARKFTPGISLQLMPTLVHYNLVDTKAESNNVFALGVGGRIKLSRRISLTGEYYYVLPDTKLNNTTNSLTLGIDIETGGHVFQLLFTNSTGITERNVIGKTDGKWSDGDIHFGFNISRVFTIVKPKGFENSRNNIW